MEHSKGVEESSVGDEGASCLGEIPDFAMNISSMRRHSSAFVAFNKSLRIVSTSSELINAASVLMGAGTDSFDSMIGGGMGAGGLILDGVDGDRGTEINVGELVRKCERSARPALAYGTGTLWTRAIWTCSKDGLSARVWVLEGKMFRIESLRETIEPCSEVGDSGNGGSSQGETLDGFREGNCIELFSISCKGES